MGCLKARGGYNCLGGAIRRGHGRVMVNDGGVWEDSNPTWVNHKGDSVSMGGIGGMGGLVMSRGVDKGGSGVTVAR